MPASTAAVWILCFAAVSSLAVWFVAAVKWHNDGFVLAFEPRKRVPWGILGALPAIWMALSALGQAVWFPPAVQKINPGEVIQNAVSWAIVALGLLLAVGVVLVGVYRATWRDFGLPASLGQGGRDVTLGVLGWLAALLPVLAIQLLSVALFRETSQNPLIKLIEEHPESQIFVAAFVSAILVAPVFEEVIFRNFLQGWLERVEDQLVGFADTKRSVNSLFPKLLSENGPMETATAEVVEPSSPSPPCSFLGLSRGFVPIVASSLLFAVAHLGHGPDPIAIFVLALFLGYVYQRTHRILPCIVLHMFFNALTLVILWLSL